MVRQQHLAEAKKSIAYLNNALKNTEEITTKSYMTTLLDAQLKVQMIANVRQDYLVRAIDEPFLPEWKAGPLRIKVIFLSTIEGLLIRAFFDMYIHYFRDTK